MSNPFGSANPYAFLLGDQTIREELRAAARHPSLRASTRSYQPPPSGTLTGNQFDQQASSLRADPAARHAALAEALLGILAPAAFRGAGTPSMAIPGPPVRPTDAIDIPDALARGYTPSPAPLTGPGSKGGVAGPKHQMDELMARLASLSGMPYGPTRSDLQWSAQTMARPQPGPPRTTPSDHDALLRAAQFLEQRPHPLARALGLNSAAAPPLAGFDPHPSGPSRPFPEPRTTVGYTGDAFPSPQSVPPPYYNPFDVPAPTGPVRTLPDLPYLNFRSWAADEPANLSTTPLGLVQTGGPPIPHWGSLSAGLRAASDIPSPFLRGPAGPPPAGASFRVAPPDPSLPSHIFPDTRKDPGKALPAHPDMHYLDPAADRAYEDAGMTPIGFKALKSLERGTAKGRSEREMFGRFRTFLRGGAHPMEGPPTAPVGPLRPGATTARRSVLHPPQPHNAPRFVSLNPDEQVALQRQIDPLYNPDLPEDYRGPGLAPGGTVAEPYSRWLYPPGANPDKFESNEGVLFGERFDTYYDRESGTRLPTREAARADRELARPDWRVAKSGVKYPAHLIPVGSQSVSRQTTPFKPSDYARLMAEGKLPLHTTDPASKAGAHATVYAPLQRPGQSLPGQRLLDGSHILDLRFPRAAEGIARLGGHGVILNLEQPLSPEAANKLLPFLTKHNLTPDTPASKILKLLERDHTYITDKRTALEYLLDVAGKRLARQRDPQGRDFVRIPPNKRP